MMNRDSGMSGSQSSKTQLGELLSRWPLLLAGFAGLASGPHIIGVYFSGAFFIPLQEQFGWSRTMVAAGPSLLIACLALSSPFVGAIADRFGELRLIAFSLLAMTIVLFVLSTLGGSKIGYLTAFAALGLLGSGSSMVTMSRFVSRSFDQARGAALAITISGNGLMAFIAPPALVGIIQLYGWQAGFVASAMFLIVAAPLVLFPMLRAQRGWGRPIHQMDRLARSAESLPANDRMRKRAFWMMVVIFPLVTLAGGGVSAHLMPMLVDLGETPMAAAKVASLIGVTIIFSRLTMGFIMDHVFAPWVGAACMGVAALGYALLAYYGPEFAALGALACGLAVGVEFDLLAFLVARYWGAGGFGRAYGILYAITATSAAITPIFYGWLHDIFGTYETAIWGSAFGLALSALLFMFLPRYDEVQPR